MLSLWDWKVHALGQQQIIRKHYKYNINSNLLESYLMKYKGFSLLWFKLYSNFCHVLFASKKTKASIYFSSLKINSFWM